MFKLLSFFLLVASVSAFTSFAAKGVRSMTMMADKARSLPFLPQPPAIVGMAGDVGFDPFGFSNSFDVMWLREAELKHGRVCMLAVAGIMGTSFYHLPGDMHNVGVVAAHDAAVGSGAMSQILLWTGIFEVISAKAISEMLDGSGRAPGDFGFDPLNLSKGKSDAVKEVMAVKELKNGRLAMLAFSGIVTQAVLTGKEFPFA